ncbi:MAG TPA: helix-turn-helix domain-containing protein, partial [Armatimonadota bacterium]|nr:helix-turn-helix domain-containing protein [Armatimonadota bacterium]
HLSHYLAKDRFPAASFPLTVEKTPQTTVVPPHTHDFVEVVFVAGGQGYHQKCSTLEEYPSGNVEPTETYRVVPGDIFVIAPGERHTYVNNESLVLYNILFLPDLLREDYNYLKTMPGLFDFFVIEPFFRSETGFSRKLHLKLTEQRIFEERLETIISELAYAEPGFEIMAKAQFLECLVIIGRACESLDGTVSQGADLPGKQQAIQRAIAFMEENFSAQLSLESIAHQVYFSAHYFCQIFKEQTGQSPWDYLTQIRLDQAKHLLLTTAKSITEIASLVGFSDSGYFAKVFKSRENISPRAYRNNMCP